MAPCTSLAVGFSSWTTFWLIVAFIGVTFRDGSPGLDPGPLPVLDPGLGAAPATLTSFR